MRNDFEPRVLSPEKVGEMLDGVLGTVESKVLEHWLAAEACADGEKAPGLAYGKAVKEFERIEAAVAEWKRTHLEGNA